MRVGGAVSWFLPWSFFSACFPVQATVFPVLPSQVIRTQGFLKPMSMTPKPASLGQLLPRPEQRNRASGQLPSHNPEAPKQNVSKSKLPVTSSSVCLSQGKASLLSQSSVRPFCPSPKSEPSQGLWILPHKYLLNLPTCPFCFWPTPGPLRSHGGYPGYNRRPLASLG